MEKLPVKLLTDLLTPDEMIAAYKVKQTHDVQFCPIGISLRNESDISRKCHCGDEEYSEFRYTPRAYFAVKVWETARDNLLKRPEFAGALDVEWYPVAASFRSVRFVNGDPEKFVAALFDEMKRLADSHTIEIRYGRFDASSLPECPDYPLRYYIMPLDLLMKKCCDVMKDELKPLQNIQTEIFSWRDIENVFVILKPIQLAFIAGNNMNYCRPLDKEFIDACCEFDLDKVKELVAKGANTNAVGYYGDTALRVMTHRYHDLQYENEVGDSQKAEESRNKYIKIAQYLLSLGCNINLAGYSGTRCLGSALYIEDLSIIKFLLDNGADPNIGSYVVGEGSWEEQESALEIVWGDYCALEGEDYYNLELLLLKYGALPVVAGRRVTPDEVDDWIKLQKEKDRWDDSVCLGLSKFDAALVNCAENMDFYYMALIAQSGGDVNLRDAKGRNLLQITFDEAELTERNRKYFKIDLAEMSLMLLCGLKLKLSAEEIEQAKATCREKGYTEALDAITSVVSSVIGQ